MSSRLPDHPNLEQLKKQAKSLLHAARAGEPLALARFRSLPAFRSASDETLARAGLALHDAQSVIAREHGFPSWNALRDEVEARTLSFDAAVAGFVPAATGGASGRAERLLALHPRIARATLEAALVVGDAAEVHRRLAADPALATAPGGPAGWPPLLYVCHTCVAQDEDRRDGLVTIARELLQLGADPNAEYHWNWHPELPRTALWGAVCTVAHLPLAEALLEGGAHPTDGVTAHIAGGGGNLAALELLARFGMDPDGIAGGVPPLVYMLGWCRMPDGPAWLLDHGADPDRAWGPEGEAPLHVAARRWDVAMVERLLARGADPNARRADGRTPHSLAEMSGKPEVAERLLAAGAVDERTPVDRLISLCARGDGAGARRMLGAEPALRDAAGAATCRLLHDAAERGDVAALTAALECGFAPDARDSDSVTPLHRAAMAGRPEAVRVLLAGGADVNARDGMFAATPLVWAVEGRRHPRPGADHVAVARVLLAAGSDPGWQAPDGAPDPESTHDALLELRREAEAG